MTQQELKEILELHVAWVTDPQTGGIHFFLTRIEAEQYS